MSNYVIYSFVFPFLFFGEGQDLSSMFDKYKLKNLLKLSYVFKNNRWCQLTFLLVKITCDTYSFIKQMFT